MPKTRKKNPTVSTGEVIFDQHVELQASFIIWKWETSCFAA